MSHNQTKLKCFEQSSSMWNTLLLATPKEIRTHELLEFNYQNMSTITNANHIQLLTFEQLNSTKILNKHCGILAQNTFLLIDDNPHN